MDTDIPTLTSTTTTTKTKHTGLIVGIILLIIIIIIIIIIVVVVVPIIRRRRTSSPLSPTPYAPYAPQPSPSPPSQTTTKYYFGTQCPTGYTDLGQIGMIADNTTKSQLPPAWTAGAAPLPNSPWTFAQPRLCRGDNTQTKDGLYKFSSTADPNNLGLAGILWNDSASSSPFTLGAPFVTGWKWTHPYIVPAAGANAYSITDTGGIGPTGITWNNNDLGNIGTFTKGAPLGSTIPSFGNVPWTWVHPNIAQDT